MSNRVKGNLNSLRLISSCFKATSAIGQPDRAGRQAEATMAEAPILFIPATHCVPISSASLVS